MCVSVSFVGLGIGCPALSRKAGRRAGAPPPWLVRTGWGMDLLGNHTKTGLEGSVEGLVDTLDVLTGDHELGALQQRQ